MLSENIKALRKKKGYSQETLAQQLFVVRQTVSKWEKGLSVPDAEMLEKLAEVLEVSVNELLGKPPVSEAQPEHNEEIARQLAILNDQLANQARRKKKILKTVLIVFITLFVIPPIIGFAMFTMFRSAASPSGDTSAYVIEDDEVVLE